MNSMVKLARAISYAVDARNFVSEIAGQDGLLGEVIDQEIVDEKNEKLILVNKLLDIVLELDTIILELGDLQENELLRD